jgi:hypothetical protein
MRALKNVLTIVATLGVAGCAAPIAHEADLQRGIPTPVRALLVVVDDRLLGQARYFSDGREFTRALGTALRDDAGTDIPVTWLPINNALEARQLPGALLSSHATQMMTVTAVRVHTNNRGEANAVWRLTVADVHAIPIPDPNDPLKHGTRVTEHLFYRTTVEAPIHQNVLDSMTDGMDKNAREMAAAINDRLQQDHVLTPDHSPAPDESTPAPGAPTHRALLPGTESL